MRKYSPFVMTLLAAWLAGCATSGDTPTIPLDSDPRVGDNVPQVCFTSSISSWSDVDNDENAVIIKVHNRDYYKLSISGGCDPQWARSHIAVIRRGGSNCLIRGDRIKTDGDAFMGYGSACIIRAINRWDPDAAKTIEKQGELENPAER